MNNLKDTAFSIDRLFVWALGIVMLVGMGGMVAIGLNGKPIPPQIQSAVMFAMGAFAGRIEKQSYEK